MTGGNIFSNLLFVKGEEKVQSEKFVDSLNSEIKCKNSSSISKLRSKILLFFVFSCNRKLIQLAGIDHAC